MLTDTTVIFRYYEGELPYIKAFIHHYVKLKAHQLVAIVQCDSDASVLTAIFSSFQSCSTILYVLHIPHERSTNACLKRTNFKAIPNIGTWVLNVDADEFIFSKKGENGEKLFSSLIPGRFDRFNIKWVMAANMGSTNQLGVQWGIGKDYALSRNIISMPNVHHFDTKRSSYFSPSLRLETNSDLGLAHHWGRTFEDTLIKMSYQRKMLNNPKNSDFISIEAFLQESELPRRLRFMAFLESLEGSIDISQTMHHDLYDIDAQHALLDPIASAKQISQLKEIYLEYIVLARARHNEVFKSFVGRGVNASCEKLPSLVRRQRKLDQMRHEIWPPSASH
ncbi:glycosyltransferase family 2 protein [Cyanobium sp. ATX 6A2]|uniref:glycosyltransferase family 2 protein n=1 Tax=Cyanobium sp. ATX 6A2 TaxID=2823700 RepID=UPI0020CC7DC2|nr:glycosyltransferase family 2 protein [Cyanobium sp. ATX 6A2]MCP9889365.1 glycosyltransferase family 2 protein [Cyanobium sp. ATX 6A2]